MQALLIILSVLVILIIMIQSKGNGLSIVPGTGDFGKFERRGPEKTMHQITVGLVVLFVSLCLYLYFVG